jgi:leader peptidase (prepilin peptidase)/N-methyltransferase
MTVMTTLGAVTVTIWAAVLSGVDMRERRLPNVLTLNGAVLILAGAAVCGRGVPAVLGAAALGGLYLAVHLCAPAALGGGDVKLALALGGRRC